MNARVLRWVGAGVLTALLVWAGFQAVEAMGEQTRVNEELHSQLTSAQQEIAAVLRTNARLADSNQVLGRVASTLRTHADTIGLRAAALEHQADVLRAERATHQPLGTSSVSDSIGFYRELLEGADREAELLRSALEQRWSELAARDSIEKLQRTQIVVLVLARDSAIAALTKVQPILGQADKALAQSEPRCRLVRIVPCPSRTAAFVGGAVVAVAAYREVERRR